MVNLLAWVYFLYINLFIVLEMQEFKNNYLKYSIFTQNKYLSFVKEMYSIQVDQGSGSSNLRILFISNCFRASMKGQEA